MDPLHADADLQRQDQRRRLLRDRPAPDPGDLGRPRRRALFVLLPVDADVHDLHGLLARDLPRPAEPWVHRGDRLDVHGARKRHPGRRHRPVRADLRLHELRDRGTGPGRQVRPGRPRLRRGRLQPRGRHGRHRDVGARQARDRPRPPHQALLGWRRATSRWFVLRVAAAHPRDPGLRDREHRDGRNVHVPWALWWLPGRAVLRPQRLRLRPHRAGVGGGRLPGR